MNRKPEYLFRGRPAYTASSVRVRNKRGGMMTQMIVNFSDGNVEVLSVTEWSRNVKPLPEMIGEDVDA